jgi:DNA modification methylase
MIKLKIDEEFQKLIPPLTGEEFTLLEKSILENGLLNAIMTWNNIIVDGHNRFNILTKNNITLSNSDVLKMDSQFDNREDVVEFILKNQLGRRNLNPDQMSIIRGRLYLLYKHQGKRTDLEDSTSNQDDGKLTTAEKIGRDFGVSKATIERDAKFVKDYPEEAEKIITTNETTKRQVKQESRIQNNNKKIEEASKLEVDTSIEIIQGDTMEILETIEDNSIDLLCTDPPYFILKDQEWDQFKDMNSYLIFIENWLESVTKKVKPTGRIYISFAHDFKFDIYEIFRKNNFFGFTFGNEIIWNFKNNVKPFDRKRYRITYEPIFYLYGPETEALNFTEYSTIQSAVWDIAVPQSNFNEGKYHPCQKPLELYRRIISSGSKKGDKVLDCFAGSGTVGIICKEHQRSCILIEKEEKYIKLIKGRINSAV